MTSPNLNPMTSELLDEVSQIANRPFVGIVYVALPECPLIEGFTIKDTYYINTCFAPPENDSDEDEDEQEEKK